MTDNSEYAAIIKLALTEDTGRGDVTSESLIPEEMTGEAYIMAKEEGVLAGGGIAAQVFHAVDPSLKVNLLIRDGAPLKPGDIIASVSGRVRSILKAERTVLNFLQRLCGIAAETSRYVAAAKGCQARIVDTRKTTPGLRAMEKYAVLMGGGQNHRMHMGDAVLIKDTHLDALRRQGLSITEILSKARQNAPKGMTIEIEVNSEAEALEAAAAGADMIMLDNMDAAGMKQVVSKLPAGVKTEASGGITLETVRAAAESGVDIISIGALTHSPKSLDISLELKPETLGTA